MNTCALLFSRTKIMFFLIRCSDSKKKNRIFHANDCAFPCFKTDTDPFQCPSFVKVTLLAQSGQHL